MHDNLDKWIKDAREVTPDSGEYRRLNRILVKERLLKRSPSRKRRHRVLITAVVALVLILFSGKVSQLGSNSFEFVKKREVTPLGDTVSVYYDAFGSGSVNLPDSYSEADVRVFNQNLAAGDGIITMVTGLNYGGRTHWIKHVRTTVNGKESKYGITPDFPESEEPPDFMDFLLTHLADLVAKTRTLPPQAETTMIVDGVLVEFGVWTFEIPDYGPVTRYVGYPVEKQ